jgi:dTDP-4-amino-4,6-dideoxygalactose transaminase
VQLAEQGIATMVHYPLPPHRQPAYNELAERSFPAAEALAADCLSLPICPTLTTADVERIAVAIRLSLQSQ